MVSTSYTFHLDPFAADHDAAIRWNEAEDSARVDVTVDRADGGPVRPPGSANPARVKGFTGRD